MITISGSTISSGVRTLEDAIPYVAGVFYNPATNGF